MPVTTAIHYLNLRLRIRSCHESVAGIPSTPAAPEQELCRPNGAVALTELERRRSDAATAPGTTTTPCHLDPRHDTLSPLAAGREGTCRRAACDRPTGTGKEASPRVLGTVYEAVSYGVRD